MAETLTATVTLHEGMHFVAVADSGKPVDLDSPAMGEGAGASPMETVLMALAGCSGMDVMAIMRKKRQPVQGLAVVARGERSETYPKVYTTIELAYHCTGEGVDPGALVQAIELSRDRYCPVWAMLRPTVAISYTYTISAPA